MKLTAGGIFAAVSAAIVLICLLVGLYLVGPPGLVRAHRLDELRMTALQNAAGVVEAYELQQGALPGSLEAAYSIGDTPLSGARDPRTGRLFDYRRTGAATYALCAAFDAASEADAPLRWRHGPGRACFAFQAKPPAAGAK